VVSPNATYFDGSTAHGASGRLDSCKSPDLTPRLNQSVAWFCLVLGIFCVRFVGFRWLVPICHSDASCLSDHSLRASPVLCGTTPAALLFPIVSRLLLIDVSLSLSVSFSFFSLAFPIPVWTFPPDALRTRTASPVECAGFWDDSGQELPAISN